MKKGFTLIELLAVIVILAIIALIAVPIILNIINDSKESSLLRSAEFYLDAVEYTIADAYLYHGGLEDKEYPITKDGDICKIELDNEGNCPPTGNVSNTLVVEVNGDKPTSGFIIIEKGKISPGTTLNIGDAELLLDNDNKIIKKEIIVGKLSSVCTPAKTQYFQQTEMEPGYEYNCKVDPNAEPYIFYVLNKNDDQINLIMDRDIVASALDYWISPEIYTEITKKECFRESEDYQCLPTSFYELGPILPMRELVAATSTWTNLKSMTINTFEKDDTTTPMAETYTSYARLVKSTEINNYNPSTQEYAYLYDHMALMCMDDNGQTSCNFPDGLESTEVSDENNLSNYATQNIIASPADYNGSPDRVCGMGPGSGNCPHSNTGIRPVITLDI